MKTDHSVYSFEKDFIPYEQAQALKEIEFDEPCLYYFYGFKHLESPIIKDGKPLWMNHNNSVFSTCYSAPTFSQVFRWFREKHGLFGFVDPIYDFSSYSSTVVKKENAGHIRCGDYTTYEEAELGCLKKLIELVKK